MYDTTMEVPSSAVFTWKISVKSKYRVKRTSLILGFLPKCPQQIRTLMGIPVIEQKRVLGSNNQTFWALISNSLHYLGPSSIAHWSSEP
jgi:hypothetical protein